MISKLFRRGALLLTAGIVAGCAAPQVDQGVRSRAGAALGGEWTRPPADLANPNVQSTGARFDRTTGDGEVRYRAGYTNTMQLRGATEDGGFRYYDANAAGGIPINFVCRSTGAVLVCQGQFQGGDMRQFSSRYVRQN